MTEPCQYALLELLDLLELLVGDREFLAQGALAGKLLAQPPMVEAAPDHRFEMLDDHGLEDVVVGAVLDALDDLLAAELSGHPKIRDDEVEGLAGDELESLRGARGRADLVAGRLQAYLVDIEEALIVIDGKDALPGPGRRHGSRDHT